MRGARIGIVVLTLGIGSVACRDKAAGSGTSASASVTASVTATATATASASASAGASALVKRPKPSPGAVVEAWNAAHMKHDDVALASLYGPRVEFYGKFLSNAECAAAKKKAFAADPTYTQTIRDLKLSSPPKGGTLTSARFVKTSTSKGKSTDYTSTLVIDANGLVIGETDDVTDKNLSDLLVATYDWCLDGDLAMGQEPNDTVKPPFKISAKRAFDGLLKSKTFAAGVASVPADHGYGADSISCPMKCEHGPGACSYDFRMIDPALTSPSRLVDWIHVDATDGTITREGGTTSEPLPPP